MQIIPYQARVRARLGGLPGLSEDPEEYRRQYLAAYAIKVKPFVGGSTPGQGLRDSDLPKGIKYLDPWAIAAFAQDGLGMTPPELARWLMDQPGDGVQRTRADSRKFAAWALMRLGAFFRMWTPPPPDAGGGSGDGGNRLRPTRDVTTPLVFNGQTLFDNFTIHAGTQTKDTLAQWADNPPNAAPWNGWPSDPNAMMALALIWANAVINQRYGNPNPRIQVFDLRSREREGERKAQSINDGITKALKDAGDCKSNASWYSLAAAVLVGAVVGFFTGGTALPWYIAALSAGAAGGASIGTGSFVRDLCEADGEEERRAILADLWNRLGSTEKRIVVAAMYQSGFGIDPTRLDPAVINARIAEIDSLGLRSAGEIAIFIARPEHDPFLQKGLEAAKSALINAIYPTFKDTVGCPGKPGVLSLLAERYLANGWTSQDEVKRFLTNVTPFTKRVASGDYCQWIESADPQFPATKTSPFPAYADAILGKGRNRTASTGDGTGPKTTVTPPPPKEEPKGSALPLALVGALGGATVGGPVGASVGFVLGLVLGSRKA
jgi:hypothetical protein